MSAAAVPVTTGARDNAQIDIDGWQVSAMTFPAGLVLPKHEHAHATVALVVRGGFAGRYGSGEQDCDATTAIVEPEGSPHANRFGARATRVVTICAPDASTRAFPSEVRAVFRRPALRRSPRTHVLAARLDLELRRPDAMTDLAVEGLALEALASLARDQVAERVEHAHVAAALEVVHDRFAERLSMADIAAEVGVHPVHLARLFRQAMHTTLGAYQRRLRVEWAARQLSTTATPIAVVADRAGFTDQSHFGRVFRAATGTTPAAYRRFHRWDR
jgi:AraC family transcriptional regulator